MPCKMYFHIMNVFQLTGPHSVSLGNLTVEINKMQPFLCALNILPARFLNEVFVCV